MKHAADVSIVIVNWNTKRVLRECLQSVYKQTAGIQLETIVVDNASGDGSVPMIRGEFPQVTIVENDRNRGFAAATNEGIGKATGRYVLLLNPDTIILDNAIAKAVQFADDHPEAAVVGCRILNPDRTLQQTCFMFPSVLNMFLSSTCLYKLFPRNKFFAREDMSWWDAKDIREVEVVKGCFMLVRREAIKHVGPMDEDFFLYGEEADWCYRFQRAGWKVLFTPGAEIIHLGAESSKQAHIEMKLQLRGSVLLFMKKHEGRIQHASACFLAAVFFLVRVPYWFAVGLLSRNGRSRHMRTALMYTAAVFKALGGGRGLRIEE